MEHTINVMTVALDHPENAELHEVYIGMIYNCLVQLSFLHKSLIEDDIPGLIISLKKVPCFNWNMIIGAMVVVQQSFSPSLASLILKHVFREIVPYFEKELSS